MANFSGTNFLYQSGLADGVPLSQGLFHNTGTSTGGSLAPWPEGPSPGNGGTSLDGDCADMDGDGDTDILLANDSNQNNRYWENALGVPDTHAPIVHQLTLVGDKSDGSDTPIQVALRDNASYNIVAFYDVDPLSRVDGGVENRLKMVSQGSLQYRATIPGGLNGTIRLPRGGQRPRRGAARRPGQWACPAGRRCGSSTAWPTSARPAAPASPTPCRPPHREAHPGSPGPRRGCPAALRCLLVQGRIMAISR